MVDAYQGDCRSITLAAFLRLSHQPLGNASFGLLDPAG